MPLVSRDTTGFLILGQEGGSRPVLTSTSEKGWKHLRRETSGLPPANLGQEVLAVNGDAEKKEGCLAISAVTGWEIWRRKGCLSASQSRRKSRLDLFPFISILGPFQVKVGMLITNNHQRREWCLAWIFHQVCKNRFFFFKGDIVTFENASKLSHFC